MKRSACRRNPGYPGIWRAWWRSVSRRLGLRLLVIVFHGAKRSVTTPQFPVLLAILPPAPRFASLFGSLFGSQNHGGSSCLLGITRDCQRVCAEVAFWFQDEGHARLTQLFADSPSGGFALRLALERRQEHSGHALFHLFRAENFRLLEAHPHNVNIGIADCSSFFKVKGMKANVCESDAVYQSFSGRP